MHLDATILYADMHDSTGLVDGYKDWFAAEIYKSYLFAACHVLRNNREEITSFDGDWVMAVFIGKTNNSDAVKVALQINSVVIKINEYLKANYKSSSFMLRQAVGIDTSKVLAARTGIRSNNDLVWVGHAANHAAKLCECATESIPTVICQKVFKLLTESSKLGGNPKKNMWEQGFVQHARNLQILMALGFLKTNRAASLISSLSIRFLHNNRLIWSTGFAIDFSPNAYSNDFHHR